MLKSELKTLTTKVKQQELIVSKLNYPIIGAFSLHSESSSVAKVAKKILKRKNLDKSHLKEVENEIYEGRKKVKNNFSVGFGGTLNCWFCSRVDGPEIKITNAHLVSSGIDEFYIERFNSQEYSVPFDPENIRNFIPLCGTLGARETCHDAFDKHVISLIYDPLAACFKLICLDPIAPQFVKSMDRKILEKIPAIKPYKRVIAARFLHDLKKFDSSILDRNLAQYYHSLADLAESGSKGSSMAGLNV